ncbi:MAG TPA: beta-L-arabinofuranosidase domain-containing protein [Candidatus Saccharimonadales bacterium]|nr:beta-L-arabinofuranosidase domain-containing protein [Candidatus Saccharimonadales bacterium]
MKTILACFLSLAVSARADSLALGFTGDKVEGVVKMEVWAFPLEEVRLLDGPFRHAMELDGAYLLSLDTERLVRNFRVNAGLPSQAEPLGGWEAPDCELRGHFVGHYMSACAQMYAATGDHRYKDKGEAVVRVLGQCQEKLRDGYLSAFPETFIDRVEQRKQVWAPYYTLHKILAGLEDMSVYCQDPEALEMARKFGDWVVARNGRLSDAQMQAMLQTEQGGMNEALANLYGLTGEKKYLEMSLRFNHHRVVDPLEAGEDRLTGLHANTQIPKFIGLARQYELTGETNLEAGARNFWETVVNHRSYVIGGNSDGEMFTATNRLWQMGPNTTETCNTYNMLKLTRHLICWEPRAEYADYYERALCNHILASQNPESGMMCYYVPLRSGSRKNFNSPDQDFWCCTGTGVENHGKYGDSIYFHNQSQIYVNQFIGSELDWKEKGLKVRQESRFPEEEQSRLTLRCAAPVELEVKVRHPGWARRGFKIEVNGQEVEGGEPGSYVTIQREWKDGDRIGIKMPYELREEGFADKPERAAVMDGPLVLGAAMDMKKPNPGIVSAPGRWLGELRPVANETATFTGPVFRIPGEEKAESLTLEPFYKLYRGNYEVYWDQFTPEQWEGREQEYAAETEKRRQMEARTVDSVNPGEEQNERDHNQMGENTTTFEFNDRSLRAANTNGWFSWDFKVLPDQPQELEVTFGGGGRGAARMDVYVDGDKLATEDLAGRRGPHEKTYALSAEQLKGKSKITVKFQAPPDARGGSVFEVRIMKPAANTTPTGT